MGILRSLFSAAAACVFFNPTFSVSAWNTTPDPSTASAVLKKHSTCCNALSVLLPGKVSTIGGAPYKSSLASFWSLQEQAVSPACVITAESTTDVSVAVFVLNIASKITNVGACKFAVKSGGHTPFAGSASIQGGVNIDLAKLNQIIVSNDQTSVNIGPGNRWEAVYLELDARNLATSGGRASTVGVGGLILGGGFSFFSPRSGLVCDNVINFQVVLASGQIVNANSTSNPDLFAALKGGSNNFGIVTSFDMKVFQQGKFWGGFVAQDISTRSLQYQYFEEFARNSTYDVYSALINSYAYTASEGWIIASNYEYTKPVAYPAAFRNFTNLPQTFNTMRISNLTDFTIEIDARSPSGSREIFVTATFKNSAAMMEKFFDLANQTVQSISDVKNMTFSLSFQPLPQVVIGYGPANGGNSLGLGPDDGDMVNVLLSIQWAEEDDDARIDAGAKRLFSQAEAVSKVMGTYNPYLYLNYAAYFQNPIKGYGNKSQAKLKKVSQKYDPGQLFQNQSPGGFKLQQSGQD